MNSMYANKITLTVNEKEAHFRFEFVVPELDESGVIGENTQDQRSVVISKDALTRIRELIDECIGAGEQGNG